MKKMKFFMIAIGLIVMASCTTAGEKAKGNYSGSYLLDSTSSFPVSGYTVSGSVNVTKVSDTKVDLLLICNSPSLSDAANGATVALSGDNVTFNYASGTNPDTSGLKWYDMITVSGTLTGNAVTLNGVMFRNGSGNGTGVFTGTK